MELLVVLIFVVYVGLVFFLKGLFSDLPRNIVGKAYVTDGDGIRIGGEEIRFAGLDAPEWDQPAKDQNGNWFNHGRYVKNALIRKIGGQHVVVTIKRRDKYGRGIGTVFHKGLDVGEWLVKEGHAKALYGNQYKGAEREARRAKRGMWSHALNHDPRKWRHRTKTRK